MSIRALKTAPSPVLLGAAAVLGALALMLAVAPAQADAHTLKLKRGATTLTVDPAVANVLGSAGITPAPIAPARATADGSLRFPITGGKVNAASLGGKIKHSGGFGLTAGSAGIELTRFTIRTRVPDLTGIVGGVRVPLLSLDLDEAKVNVNEKRGKVRVKNVGADLTSTAADALNATFSTDAFAEGVRLGTAKVKGKGKVR